MEYNIQRLHACIDAFKKEHIRRLKEIVALKSISSTREHRPELMKTMEYVANKLKKMNFNVDLRTVGTQIRLDGENLPLPKVIMGEYGNDLRKRTVLIYGHLDVEPANPEEWSHDPFTMTEKGEYLVGRGTADDKGPVLAWINTIECFQMMKIDIPVNIKVMIEGMEEAGSEGLQTLICENKTKFLNNVDYVVMSNSYWLGKTKPCVTYGVRGLIYFYVKINCAKREEHSGIYGGNIHEAVSDMAYLFDSLKDPEGKILVPGIYEQVRPITDEERSLYENIDFNSNSACRDLGHKKLIGNPDKTEILMNRWRQPCINIHGIQGDFSDPGAETVIPNSINGKFSMRVVPDMNDLKCIDLITTFLKNKMVERDSPNALEIMPFRDCPGYLNENVNDPQFIAAKRACHRVWGTPPDVTREGASIPIANYFAHITGKSVLLLPLAQSNHECHNTAESISKTNYLNGMKVIAAYLFELAAYKENKED